jgi:hypothetical protein
MPCPHPAEERRPVYQGGSTALRDRTFCALCGEVLLTEARIAATVEPARKTA